MRTKNLLHSRCLTLSEKYITIRLLHNRGRLATAVINESLFCLTMGDGSVRLVLQTGNADFQKDNNPGSKCRHILLVQTDTPGLATEQSVENVTLHLSSTIKQSDDQCPQSRSQCDFEPICCNPDVGFVTCQDGQVNFQSCSDGCGSLDGVVQCISDPS